MGPGCTGPLLPNPGACAPTGALEPTAHKEMDTMKYTLDWETNLGRFVDHVDLPDFHAAIQAAHVLDQKHKPSFGVWVSEGTRLRAIVEDFHVETPGIWPR